MHPSCMTHGSFTCSGSSATNAQDQLQSIIPRNNCKPQLCHVYVNGFNLQWIACMLQLQKHWPVQFLQGAAPLCVTLQIEMPLGVWFDELIKVHGMLIDVTLVKSERNANRRKERKKVKSSSYSLTGMLSQTFR